MPRPDKADLVEQMLSEERLRRANDPALVPLPGAAASTHEIMLTALKSAHQFIRNGIELGYIRMPDADCHDTAHLTPRLVEDAIKAGALPSPPDGWQDISTAPKDGRWLLVVDRSRISGDGITLARFDSDLGINHWYSGLDAGYEDDEPLKPTHWMPLPPPPQPPRDEK
jgi:hypothetical protein